MHLGFASLLPRRSCMSDLTHVELFWLEKRIEKFGIQREMKIE